MPSTALRIECPLLLRSPHSQLTGGHMAGNEAAARSGCPVEEYSTAGPRKEPLAYFRRLDELRDRSRPFFWTETEPGYYVFLDRSEEHTSELQSLMRISYAVL